MGERIGQEVRSDDALLTYARQLWSSGEYKTWRAHMRQDVEDSLSKEPSRPIENYLEEA